MLLLLYTVLISLQVGQILLHIATCKSQSTGIVFNDICTWAGYYHILCMGAVVDAHSTVGTVCQPGLRPSTSYVVEEDGPGCGLIHRE